ncbi:hypothetical protein BCR36DRAFT_295196 [Piromyces finnis]|uniref:Uncharacterized protein n=1 Tax=Piromyces finnis TaxID=1754191 RepID=A0A1Y1V6M2_9FUNG|nr:hypothetical protein BCR36DRAFT_295196 [Piromyces finnis]|eukprot:ORX47668.1 hypothetical protein BCR36DRAFT_295196 [Piromyces finnis]
MSFLITVYAYLFDFKKIAPEIPNFKTDEYDATTGYPNEKFIKYTLNGNNKKPINIEEVINEFFWEYYDTDEYIIDSITSINENQFSNVFITQTFKNYEIFNSKIKIVLNNKNGLILSKTEGIWKNFSVKDFEERDLVYSLAMMLLSMSNILNVEIDFNDVFCEEKSNNSFIAQNVKFSSNGEVLITKGLIGNNNNQLEAAWKLDFLLDYVYVSFVLSDLNGKIISGINYVSKFTMNNDVSNINSYIDSQKMFNDISELNIFDKNKYSPFGWNQDQKVNYMVTIGNNARVVNGECKYISLYYF